MRDSDKPQPKTQDQPESQARPEAECETSKPELTEEQLASVTGGAYNQPGQGTPPGSGKITF